MLSPSYLRRPDSYDRLGAPVPGQQRFLANRLLVGAAGTAPGRHIISTDWTTVIHCIVSFLPHISCAKCGN